MGRFQILERVGMGGFGAVYRAQDPQLQRTVALKLLQSTGDEQRDQHRISRFLIEGRAGARLQHPHIVPVFDAGRDEESGEYYLAAAFITGEPLSTAIDGKPMELRRAVTIVSQLARALEYAHSQGILHRDIKPDNVMLDQQGVPHLMDFGLARMEESESNLTRDGAVMGTPSYMSPEQCVGKQEALGPAADQYSLGCLFYELLTGDKLFSGPVSVQIHHQINTEASAPGTKQAAIPKDLDTICLKTLSKEPERRYGSCAELASDLDRWLADEPIQARQLTTWERLDRWRRRNPVIAGLSLGLAASLLIGFFGITTQWVRAESHARAALLAAEEQTKAKQAAQKAESSAVKDRETARKAAASNKRIAYSAHMNLGQQAWGEADIAFMHELLDRYLPESDGEDLRCFEWYYWWRLSHGYLRRFDVNGGQVIDVTFSPDQTTLATASKDRLIKLWNVETGEVRTTLSGHSDEICCLLFSPDGKTLASGSADGTAILWDVESNQLKQTLHGDGGAITALSFSTDGRSLYSASQKLTIWDLTSDEPKTTATGLQNWGSIQSGFTAAFSPDNKKLIVANTIWDVASGEQLVTLNGHSDRISSVAFSPDGKTVATGSWDHDVKLWDVDSGKIRVTCDGHSNHVFDVTFSPDGKTLASAGRDLTVRLWDVTTGLPIDMLKGHSARISTLAFSSNGRMLASAGRDYLVTLWDVTLRQPQASVLKHPSSVRAVAFTPDNQTIATGVDGDSLIRLWDVKSGIEKGKIDNIGSAKIVVFSPDGAVMATGSKDNIVRLWGLATSDLIKTFPSPVSSGLTTLLIRCLTFSPDGKVMAANGDAGSINLWHPYDGKLIKTLTGDGHDATGTAFSPDGKLLAAGSVDHSVKVWDVATGRRLLTLTGHKEPVWTVAFSCDGTILASGGMDTTVKLWDVATGALRMNLVGHTDTVSWLSFAPDGKTMATTSGDATVKLWDVITGDLKTTLTGHADYNYSVSFSPDGMTLASGGLDKTVRVWRAGSEAQVKTVFLK